MTFDEWKKQRADREGEPGGPGAGTSAMGAGGGRMTLSEINREIAKTRAAREQLAEQEAGRKTFKRGPVAWSDPNPTKAVGVGLVTVDSAGKPVKDTMSAAWQVEREKALASKNAILLAAIRDRSIRDYSDYKKLKLALGAGGGEAA